MAEEIEVIETGVDPNSIPTIDNEEDLKRVLGGEPEPKGDDAAAAKKKADEQAAAAKKKAEEDGADDPFGTGKKKDEDDDEQETEEEKTKREEEEAAARAGKKVGDYPTIVHWLNDQHQLGLNLEEVESLTPDEQADALSEVVTRMTNGVNKAIEDYQYIETLMQDQEIRSLLEAKSEGKGLKDLYEQFNTTAQSLNDDDLALKDFKKRFPKATEEAVRGMVDSLKKSNQFDPFVKGLREQHEEEQSFSKAENEKREAEQKRIQAENEKRELEEFGGFVGSLQQVYGVPLTNEMKENVLKAATLRDDQGRTYLDNALQSNEGVVLATLGIMYMKNLVQNSASLQGNRKNAKLMDKLFKTTDKLQSSAGDAVQKDDEKLSAALMDRF